MFESQTDSPVAQDSAYPAEAAAARRRARDWRRYAARVQAVHGPRPLVAWSGRARFGSPLEAAESLRAEPGAAAAALRQVASAAEASGGEVGAAVCLTASLVIAGLEAPVTEAGAGRFRGGLGRDRERLLEALERRRRPALAEDLQALLTRRLDAPVRLPAGAAGAVLAPARAPGVRVLARAGNRLEVGPAAGAPALPDGRRDGPHRVFAWAGGDPAQGRMRAFLAAAGRFEVPALLLVPPGQGLEGCAGDLAGPIHGRVLAVPPAAVPGFVPRVRVDAPPPPGRPEVDEVLWLDDGMLLFPRVDAPGGATAAVLLGPGRRAEIASLRRIVRSAEGGGLLPGGGAAYLAAARDCAGRLETPFAARALEAPLRVLLANEGMDADGLLSELSGREPGAGYDVLRRRFLPPQAPEVTALYRAVRGALDAGFRAAARALADAGADHLEGTEHAA